MFQPYNAGTPPTRGGVIAVGTTAASRRETALRYISWALLAFWCAWWTVSHFRGELVGVRSRLFQSCLEPWTFGCDFIWHIHAPARDWLGGKNPYEPKSESDIFLYPPLVLRAFAWVGLVPAKVGQSLWTAAILLMTAVCCRRVWHDRKRLGLEEYPYPTLIVAMLFCGPMIFAVERGQFDLLTAPLVLAGLALMRRESRLGQWTAGAVMAVAPLLKVYPGILGAGLLGLRRGRALAGFVIVGLVVCVALHDQTQQFLVNIGHHTDGIRKSLQLDQGTQVYSGNMSFPDSWPRIWRETPLRLLSNIPGPAAAALILGSLLIAVSWRMNRCAERSALAFPYLLWIVAVGSFVPPGANSYNVVFLPMAALTVCSRRDSLPCRALFWGSVVWLVPIELPVEGRWQFLLKIGTLAAVGWSLIQRANELSGCRAETDHGTNDHTETTLRLAA
jgi:hypothetical protein